MAKLDLTKLPVLRDLVCEEGKGARKEVDLRDGSHLKIFIVRG